MIKNKQWFFLWILVLGLVVLFVVLMSTLIHPTSTSTTSANQNETKNDPFRILDEDMLQGSGEYKDVLYHCPSIPSGTFQQMVALHRPSNTLIAGSNSYLSDEVWITTRNRRLTQEYEQKYNIYNGMHKAYQYVKLQNSHSNTQNIIHIEHPIVVFANSFDGVNSGHALGNLMATLLYIQHHQLHLPPLRAGIQELAFKFPRILEILELFHDRSLWYTFQTQEIYHMDVAHFVVTDPRFIVQEYQNPEVTNLVEDILFRSELRLASEGCIVPHGAKILLLKQVQNTSLRVHDAFYGAAFLAKMNENGWIIINPELDSMWYIISLLHHASHIVCSFGSIMWTHMLFFNPDANITHLQIGEERAYPPVQDMTFFKSIVLTETNLDHPLNEKLIDNFV